MPFDLSAPPAVQAAAANTETYPAGFFAPYAPQTALDMARQLPGFRLDLGATDVRGFGEAGGNVLVDGARPASKSGGLAAVLSAIPARQVARIEIARSSGASSEASGQVVVANIVRVARRGGVNTEAKLMLEGGHVLGNAAVTATRAIGAFDLTARTTFDAQGERSHGERSQLDLAGRLKGRQALTYATDFPEWAQRLTLDGVLAGGRFQTVGMVSRARLSEGFSFVEPGKAERFPKRTGRWRGEISGDWARTVGAGYALKLLGLANVTDVDARSFS